MDRETPLRWLDRVDALLGRPAARWLAPLSVLAVAAAMRIVYYAQLSGTRGFARPLVDAKHYDEMARGVLDGTWPTDSVFFVDPLYAYVLAAKYALFGTEASGVLVMQLALGVVTVGLLYLLARAFLRPSEALLAGLLAATYPVFLFFEGLVLKTSLSVLVLTATLLVLVHARRGRPWLSLAAGILLGLGGLLRGNLLALAPVLFGWLLLTNEERRVRRLVRPLLLTLGTLLSVLPVTLHNLRAGDTVLTTANAGQNLYTGNGAHNTTGTYVAPPGVRSSPVFEEADFARVAEEELGRELAPSEVSRYWTARTLHEARADVPGTLRRLGHKTLLFLNAVEVPDNESFDLTAEEVPLLRWPLPCWGVLLIFAAASLCLVRWTPEQTLVGLVTLTVGLTVVAFFVNARFRLTAVPGLLLLAAALPGAIAEGIASGRWTRGALSAAAAFLALFVTTRDVYDVSRTMLFLNDAGVAADEGDPQAALALLERALAEDAENWHAHALRGEVLAGLGRDEEAEDALRRATELAPRQPGPWLQLGTFFSQRNRLGDAEESLERAVTTTPDRADARALILLADVERRRRRFDEARAHLEELLARDAKHASGWTALAQVEYAAGESAAAVEAQRRAVTLRPRNLRFQLELGRLLERAGAGDEARGLYRAILAEHPENAEARSGLRRLDG